MKKAAILVSAALICGTLVGYLCMKDDQPAAPAQTQQSDPGQFSATTRQPEEYKPAFGAVNVPEEMKQHYTINPKASQVITGSSGTMLLIPDNAFTDKDGNAVSGKVKLELIEAITREDMIAMNMGTMSDQGMLETGGTIYVGAKSESGEELVLAEGKTIETEIPAMQVRSGMQLWEGQQEEDGSISWKNPSPIDNGLREIPVENIDIALEPEQKEGDAQPELYFDVAQKVKADTIMIQRIVMVDGHDWQPGVWQVTNGTWARDTSAVVAINAETNQQEVVSLNDAKFEHTNIATAEFRSRLPFIRQACDARVMGCYTNFPTRPLWKSDLAAADSLEKTGCPLADLFKQFAAMKQEKVDTKDRKTAAALDAAREKAILNYSTRVAEQRAAYASYSFGMKSLGWANIDRLCGSGLPIVFNAHVDAVTDDAAPRVSLLIPGRGIYLPGYKRPNGNYSFTHGENEQAMAYPQGEHAFILAEMGEGDTHSYALKEVVFGSSVLESLVMHPGTEEQMAKEMGNLPPEKKEPGVKIIDDWYTQSLKNGTGCLCGWGKVAK